MSAPWPLGRLRKHALPVAVVITTVVIIAVAIFQYRWNASISEATGVRMADTLQMSIVNWQIDLVRNLRDIEHLLRPAPGFAWRDGPAWRARVQEWQALARYPTLIDGVYLVDPASPAGARRLNLSTGTFDAAASPLGAGPHPAPPPDPTGGHGWRFDPTLPALIRPVEPASASSPLAVVVLTSAVIRGQIFPDLAHRYFQGTDGLDYEVAVVAEGRPPTVLYESDRGFGASKIEDADGTLDVFGSQPSGDRTRPPVQVFHKTPTLVSIEQILLTDSATAHAWRLVVRHRRGGPLGTFLVSTSRRDLYISAAALALLVASIAMLVISSSRAQKLAALQMDFVATVSHELRTPLTVISSAADNITQGVVEDPGQVRRYGAVIATQARQLSALVEQILLFARHGHQPQAITLAPVTVDAIVDATLAGTTHLIEAAAFTVERRVPAGLPPVQGDVVAVSQCLQNFIVNALKYGRDGRWLGISASESDDGSEVRLAVSDRGQGIAADELTHIFEPFFRGREATRSQIHGTGLGLAVARELATAMHGRVSVETRAGQGSTFTLHLPACAPSGLAATLPPREEAQG